MAKNYIAPGSNITMTAPYALTSGQGALVGALFGVAQHDAASGAPVVLGVDGVYDLPKEAPLVIAAGARLFWDSTNKRLTTTSTSNFAVAIATVAALSADTTVRVLLERSTPAGT